MPVPQIDLISLTQQIAALEKGLQASQNALSNPERHFEAAYGRKPEAGPLNFEINRLRSEVQGYSEQLAPLREKLQSSITQAGLSNDIGIQSLINQAAKGDVLAGQALQERLATEQRTGQEQTQLANFRTGFEQEQFGTNPEGKTLSLEESLAQAGPGGVGGGTLGTLGRSLAAQSEKQLSQVLRPELRNALGARGLEDSGALGALLGREAVGLEQSRQSSLLQAGLGAKSQISGLQRADILGDIEARRRAISGGFDLQRAGITMQFQRELAGRQEALARELASLGGGGRGIDFAKLGLGIGSLGSAFIPGINPILSGALGGAGISGIFGSMG